MLQKISNQSYKTHYQIRQKAKKTKRTFEQAVEKVGDTFEDINKFELKDNKSNYVADKIEISDEKNIQ